MLNFLINIYPLLANFQFILIW